MPFSKYTKCIRLIEHVYKVLDNNKIHGELLSRKTRELKIIYYY